MKKGLEGYIQAGTPAKKAKSAISVMDRLLLCACALCGALLCAGIFSLGRYALSRSAAMAPEGFAFYSDLLTEEGAAHTLYDFQAGDTITLKLYNYNPDSPEHHTGQAIEYTVLVNGKPLSDKPIGSIPGDSSGFAVETLAISAQDMLPDSSGSRTVTLALRSTAPYEKTLWGTFTLVPPAREAFRVQLSYEGGRYILTVTANRDVTLSFTTPQGLSLDASGAVLSSPFSVAGGESAELYFVQSGYLVGELSADSFDVRESDK